MDIITTTTLSSNQYHDAKTLIDLCRLTDNTKGINFLENDVNYYHDFPCFYFMYKDNVLVSFLSVFVPDGEECEIYAHTLPRYRKQGYFRKLFEAAYENIKNFGIGKICFVNEPGCYAGEQALTGIGAKFESSEYLMAYNMRLEPKTQGTLTLKYQETGEGHELDSYRGEIPVGRVRYHMEDGVATLYGVEVEAKYRGRRFGVETVMLAVQYLIGHGCERIILHVSGSNKVAYHLYTHHGFIHVEQLDYWVIHI